MNDDDVQPEHSFTPAPIEELLRGIRPPAAPPALREEILAAVGEQLRKQPARWDLRLAAAAAALLIVAVVSSQLVRRAEQQRLANLYGPRPTPQSVINVADAIRSVSDDETALWFQRRLATISRQRKRRPSPLSGDWKRVLDEFTITRRVLQDDQTEEDSEVGNDRQRGNYRDPAGHSHRTRLGRGVPA